MRAEYESGSAAAVLGNWGSPNTHADFGWTRGYADWTKITGTWTSMEDETSLDILLYGTTGFAGHAYFDEVTVEKIGPSPGL